MPHMPQPAFTPALPLSRTTFRRPMAPQPSGPRTGATRRPASAVQARASRERRAENVPGDLFVDASCIDCDTCRWLTPQVFHAANGQSAVHAQPTTPALELAALQAAAACPTGSIRTSAPSPLARRARDSFPLPARTWEDELVPHVFYNGFTSTDTFACSSWLLLNAKPATPCNVMFDCPRFFEPLARRIDQLTAPTGGVHYLVLSHRDDVANHDKWASRLGAQRVIHANDSNSRQGTDMCELKLTDADFPYELSPGVEVLHVPGHTKGSIALLHRESQSLFTGDHLAWSSREQRLSGFPRYCQHSWDVQMDSVAKLEHVPFLHVWPGHGRSYHFADEDDRRRGIREVVENMASIRARVS